VPRLPLLVKAGSRRSRRSPADVTMRPRPGGHPLADPSSDQHRHVTVLCPQESWCLLQLTTGFAGPGRVVALPAVTDCCWCESLASCLQLLRWKRSHQLRSMPARFAVAAMFPSLARAGCSRVRKSCGQGWSCSDAFCGYRHREERRERSGFANARRTGDYKLWARCTGS